jgi:hypothetical protein
MVFGLGGTSHLSDFDRGSCLVVEVMQYMCSNGTVFEVVEVYPKALFPCRLNADCSHQVAGDSIFSTVLMNAMSTFHVFNNVASLSFPCSKATRTRIGLWDLGRLSGTTSRLAKSHRLNFHEFSLLERA